MFIRLQPLVVFSFILLLLIANPGIAPAQTYDWISGLGPEGGAVFDLAEAPNGDIYAALWFTGGVYRSTDGGVNWAEAGLQGFSISELVINGAGDVFAAGWNTRVYRLIHGATQWESLGNDLVDTFGALAYDPDLDILYAARWGKVSRSLDGGDTWGQVSTSFPETTVHALAVVPNGGPLFAGTDPDKVFRSIDGGVTWSPFDTGFPANGARDLLVVPEGNVYAATYGGHVAVAPWDGAEWKHLSTGLADRFCLSIGRDPSGSLWAGTINSGTFVSHNEGDNWAAARTGLGMREVWSVVFLDSGDYLAATNGGGIFRSTNSGATWSPSSAGMYRAQVEDFVTVGSGASFAAVQGSGVHRSDDGGATWYAANVGIDDFECTHLALHPDGTLFVGTWDDHIFLSLDNGASWGHIATYPTIFRVGGLAVDPATGDLYAGGLASGGLWRSTDKGSSWTDVSGDLPAEFVTSVVIEDDGDLLMTTYYQGIQRSQNGGVNWHPLNSGRPDAEVSQLLSLPGGVMFAAVNYYGLYRSLDDGASWNLVDASLDNPRIKSVAVNSSGLFFCGSVDDGAIYRSSDGGDTWEQVSDFWPNTGVSVIGFDSTGRLLAGLRNQSVKCTVGTTPVPFQTITAARSGPGVVQVTWFFGGVSGLESIEIHRAVNDGPRRLLGRETFTSAREYVFTDREAPDDPCAYWLRLIAETGDFGWYGPVNVDKAELAGPGLVIDAVWPNPVVGSATIRFSVPRNESGRLEIYDLRGRLVRRLLKDVGAGDAVETSWNLQDGHGRRVPAGTYFVRLSAGQKTVTRKTLVKGR